MKTKMQWKFSVSCEKEIEKSEKCRGGTNHHGSATRNKTFLNVRTNELFLSKNNCWVRLLIFIFSLHNGPSGTYFFQEFGPHFTLFSAKFYKNQWYDWGVHHINPSGQTKRACFRKMSPLASKLLDLEAKQILDKEIENQPIWRFCYLKIWHFGFQKPRHLEC